MGKDQTGIKCTYRDGLFPNEYVATIPTTSGYESYFVKKDDILPLNQNKGLLKIIVKDKDNSRALISLNDVGDCKRSYAVVSVVSLENLLPHKNKKR